MAKEMWMVQGDGQGNQDLGRSDLTIKQWDDGSHSVPGASPHTQSAEQFLNQYSDGTHPLDGPEGAQMMLTILAVVVLILLLGLCKVLRNYYPFVAAVFGIIALLWAIKH